MDWVVIGAIFLLLLVFFTFFIYFVWPSIKPAQLASLTQVQVGMIRFLDAVRYVWGAIGYGFGAIFAIPLILHVFGIIRLDFTQPSVYNELGVMVGSLGFGIIWINEFVDPEPGESWKDILANSCVGTALAGLWLLLTVLGAIYKIWTHL